MQVMYGTAGYANSVTNDLMTQTSEAITSLAQASAQDRIAVADVSTNNTTILDQLTQAIATLATVQSRLMLIEGRLGGANSGSNGGGNNGGNGGANGGSNGGNGATRNPRQQ